MTTAEFKKPKSILPPVRAKSNLNTRSIERMIEDRRYKKILQ